MRGNLLKVKDDHKLSRDTRSNAIISTDESAYQAALLRKKKSKRIDKMEDDINQLKTLMQTLIEKLDK